MDRGAVLMRSPNRKLNHKDLFHTPLLYHRNQFLASDHLKRWMVRLVFTPVLSKAWFQVFNLGLSNGIFLYCEI
jgi:hypothetical protein